MGIRVVAVDIGSVGPSSKFAWAAFDAPERQVMAAGTDPGTVVSALAPGLLSGARAALLLEAPIPVPVPDGQPDAWRTLGKARNGEGSRPWSAGSRRRRTGDRTGAGCMDAAPASRHGAGAGSGDTARILAARRCAAAAGQGVHHPGRRARTAASRPGRCRCGGGRARAGRDAGRLRPLASSVRCVPQEPFNLLAAMALWAELGLTLPSCTPRSWSLPPALSRGPRAC